MKYMLITDSSVAISVLQQFTDKVVFADTEAGILPKKLDYLRDELKSLPYPDLRKDYPNLRTIQFLCPEYNNDIVFIIDLDLVEINDLREYIEPLHTVWANAPYDLGMLGYPTAIVDDVQLAVRTAYPKLSGFKMDIIAKELGMGDLYVGIDKSKAQKGFSKGVELTEEQLLYCVADVRVLHRLYTMDSIKQVMDKLFYKIDMISLGYSIQYQQNGLVVDKSSVELELTKLPKDIAKNEEILQGINANSPKQVKEKFTELLGGREPASTGKEFLIQMITKAKGTELGEFAKAVFDQRRLLKRKAMLESYNYDKVYTRFNPYGAGTGRFSASGKGLPNGINSQQIPRDLQYIFNKDTDDTVVIHADYSTAELRAACSLMGDSTMRKYLLEGRDLHKVSAMLADSSLKYDNVTKEQRQKGKAISFGLIFGMGVDRFIEYAYTEYGVVFTQEEAKEIKYNYQNMYKEVTNYHMTKWKNYKTVPAESPMGRLSMPRMGTDAINFSTQSSIGETTKLAIHYLVKDFGDEAIHYIYNIVHDAIYLRVPIDKEEEWTKALVASMLKAWTEIVKLPLFKFKDIPMGVEYEVGSRVQEIFDIKDFKW